MSKYTLEELEDLYYKGIWITDYNFGYRYAELLLGDQWEGQWLTPTSYLSY